MPKNTLIIVIVILILAGGAFWYFKGQQMGPQSNVITSIKDSLSKSVSLECNYTDEQGRTSKSSIKNGEIRSDYTGKTTQESGSIIVTGKKMYMWTPDKQGFMLDIPQVTETPAAGNGATGQGLSQKDNLMSDLEKYKQDCKAAVVSESLFTPPADVKFTDYSQMMQQVPTGYMMPKTQDNQVPQDTNQDNAPQY